MEHNHVQDKTQPASLKNLFFAIVINGGIVAFEIVFGLLIQSMALISDAVHNLSDIAAMGFSYWAEKVSGRPANERKTYGYHKIEFIAAFVNSLVLSVAIAFILWEALGRLTAPPAIPGREMLWVAVIAFAGNGAAAFLLRKLSSRNLNMKSAFLHMLADAATSLGVVVLGIIWMFKPWYWLDPVFCWLIVAMILYGGWDLIKESVLILMNATPSGMDLEEVRKALESLDGIEKIHDLHIWRLSSESIALAVHITVPDQMLTRIDELADRVRTMLFDKFNIDHPTLQFECNSCRDGKFDCQGARGR